MRTIRLSIMTLGCRANQYDSLVMRGLLHRAYRVLPDAPSAASRKIGGTTGGIPDVAILNACAVTQLAERKAGQLARRIRRERPGASILLVGCLADAVAHGTARFDSADLLAGNSWKNRICDAVAAAIGGRAGILPEAPLVSLDEERTDPPEGRVRAWMKVQDGCSGICTYCRPTQVRGPSRSKRIAAAVREASELLDRGVREIVLTGIDLARYAPAGGTLADLVRSLLALPALVRLRLASINPQGITEELLQVLSSDRRVCPYLHIPLQSGADGVLARMARSYTVEGYIEKVTAVRRVMPSALLGTDIIVGFPGEDLAAFSATCALVRELAFSNLHVFRFSERAGTEAQRMQPKVSEHEKRERAARLASIWQPTRDSLLDSRISTTQDVLVEQHCDDSWRGYTPDYIAVVFSSRDDIPLGGICRVRIVGRSGDHLEGVIDHRQHAS